MALRLARRYWSANIGLQYQRLDWENFPHQDLKIEVEQYIEQFEFMRASGTGITFYSPTLGVGKTWAATYVLKELVKHGVDGWFVSFWDLMQFKDRTDKEAATLESRKVMRAELVLIDDVKDPYTSRQQEYYSDKLEEFVRSRTDHNLPTIITTNMTETQMDEKYGRVFSLLMAKNFFHELTGSDARMDGTVWAQTRQLALHGEMMPIT